MVTMDPMRQPDVCSGGSVGRIRVGHLAVLGATVIALAAPVVASEARPDEGAPYGAAVRKSDRAPDVIVEVGQAAKLDGSKLRGPRQGAGLTYRWRHVTEPDVTESLPTFECPTNWAERYATRVRGFLHPPASGAYTFWSASDDASELRLSTDEAPANARLITHVQWYTSPRGWDETASQKSTEVRLEAGARYYIEVLHKEGGGGDHLAVAWSRDGGDREIIDGRYLSPFVGADSGRVGSITREAWLGIGGSAISDLTTSPRYTAISSEQLTGADKAVATFTPERGGHYDFELQATDGGQWTGTHRIRVLATDIFRNGSFEDGDGVSPAFWQPPAQRDGIGWTWSRDGGVKGSRCVSVTSAGLARAVWRQPLQLAPFTAYLLTGYMRGARLQASETGKHAATIGVDRLYLCENGPETGTSELEWTRFRVDFATGPSGKVDIICRLGALGEAGSGTVCFDDLSVARNPDVETFEGSRFILHLYKDQVETATRKGVERMVEKTDAACDAMAELTGYWPPGWRQSAWAPRYWRIGALGWAGNPVLWTGQTKILERWSRDDYCAEVFLHELAHNFDHPSWTFHIHFNELKMYYALEALGFSIAEDGWTKGAETRHRWELRSRRERSLGMLKEVGQVYRNIQIRDQVGWEPFRKVHRHFLALADEDMPKTPWSKFKLWHDKLAEYSGQDVWSVYSKEEVAFIEQYYAPRLKPWQLRELGAVPDSTRSISLTDVKWQSATVGWEKPAYEFHMSGEKAHPHAIYAHAVSRYVYPTDRKWKTFRATCGLAKGRRGSVVFVIRADGREVFRSALVADAKEHLVTADISAASVLELIVEDGGNGKNSDHGIWFSPRLER